MLKKGTKRYSIQKLKCPRCHEGDLFVNPTFFVYKKMLEMPDKCSVCGQDFVIEPGFYTAALWISYPILLIVIIPTIATGVIMKDTNFFLRKIFPFIVLFIALMMPALMRISRAILINLHVRYKEF